MSATRGEQLWILSSQVFVQKLFISDSVSREKECHLVSTYVTCYLSRDSLLVAVDFEQINRNRRSIETSFKLFPAEDLFLHRTFSEMFSQETSSGR